MQEKVRTLYCVEGVQGIKKGVTFGWTLSSPTSPNNGDDEVNVS